MKSSDLYCSYHTIYWKYRESNRANTTAQLYYAHTFHIVIIL